MHSIFFTHVGSSKMARFEVAGVTKMTKSSLLKKKPALKEAQQEGGAELDTAEKQTLNEVCRALKI